MRQKKETENHKVYVFLKLNPKIMKLSFFLVFITLFLGMMAYVLIRGYQIIPPKPTLRPYFIGGFIFLLFTLFCGIFLEHKLGPALTKIVTFTGYTFLLVVLYMLLSFVLMDLVRLANSLFHFTPVAGMMTVRQWAAVISIVIIAIALGIGNYQFNHPKVVSLSLSAEQPRQHREIRIIAVSDIHLGSSIDKKRLHQYVQMINARKPDIILLAGDITDRSIGAVTEQRMQEELRSLHAPLGTYAISGNHEFYSGVPDQIASYLRASGITVLHDSMALVDSSFYIIGRDDRTNRNRKPLAELVRGLNPNLPKILLDHQPYHLEEASANGIDLQFSGHTHNGQFFPGNLFVKAMYELGYGYLKKGKTHYYISSGLGIWGPQYRIGTQSELVEITFKY
jgi:uncharacterized protein